MTWKDDISVDPNLRRGKASLNGARPMKQCPQCGGAISIGNRVCPDCGEDLGIRRIPPWLLWILLLGWLMLGGFLHLPPKVSLPLGIVLLLSYELWIYRLERLKTKPKPHKDSHLT